MKLKLENIGKIKKAEIDINGLTVIAGENDTGKSTVGKVMFSLVKVLNNYKDDFEKRKHRMINDYIYNIKRNIFRHNFRKNDKDLEKLINILIPGNIDIENYKYEQLFLKNEIDYTNFIENYRNFFDNLDKNSDFYKEHGKFLSNFNDIVYKLLGDKDDINKFNDEINIFLINIFSANINNSVHVNSTGKIELENFIRLKIEKNQINTEKFDINIEKGIYKDSTFIDNALIIDSYDQYLHRYFDFYENIYSKTILDLAKKIDDIRRRKLDISNIENKKIIDDINKIINGTIYFDKSGDLKYKINNKSNPLSTLNMASGGKSFALLELLTQGGYICDGNHLLILDEPENHLHPEWQIKYAEILIYLINNFDLNVIITSHSPYFIQGLYHYVKEMKLSPNKVNFYLSDKVKNETNYSEIKKVNKMDEIFVKFSEPLKKVYYSNIEDD